MGKEFLRHVERCRVLVYMVDAGHPDPAASYHMLRSELLRHDPALLELPSVLALSKADVLGDDAEELLEGLRSLHERTLVISAVTHRGLDALVHTCQGLLEKG
jgi:GTP-binding protein